MHRLVRDVTGPNVITSLRASNLTPLRLVTPPLKHGLSATLLVRHKGPAECRVRDDIDRLAVSAQEVDALLVASAQRVGPSLLRVASREAGKVARLEQRLLDMHVVIRCWPEVLDITVLPREDQRRLPLENVEPLALGDVRVRHGRLGVGRQHDLVDTHSRLDTGCC